MLCFDIVFYNELVVFVQFGSDLDVVIKVCLDCGEWMMEVLK